MKRTRLEEIDTLLEQTSDSNPKVRARAVQSLCPCHVTRNDERVWDRVLELVDDPAITCAAGCFICLAMVRRVSVRPKSWQRSKIYTRPRQETSATSAPGSGQVSTRWND